MAADQRGEGGIATTLQELTAVLSKLCDGQAALAHGISELVSAQKDTTSSIEKLVAMKQEAIVARPSLGTRPTLDAGQRLTNTYELLEQILLHTDMATVFFAQRVNTSFQDTINNSRVLQQKLFFAPLPANGSYQEAQLNPLLVKKEVLERLPFFYCGYGINEMQYAPRWPGERLRPDMPVITHSGTDEDAADGMDWELSVWSGLEITEVLGAGSWRRMLLTQPACIASFAIRSDNSYDPNSRSRATISTEHVMDKFIDALVDAELEGEI
ncbi:hypothetical protein LTR17_000537 [Elasticomyces elasticus]|nr:hypothetical protein LTR17_000537 [Elasticomyces elasticus]